MNAVGRQMPSSGASTAHHQRQYSDNFLDTSSNGRWLQSAGLQHMQASSNNASDSQDFGSCGGGGGVGGRGVQGSRAYRNAQRNLNGGNDFFSEPSTPPVVSRSSSQRKIGEENVSPSELSPGILDLHSFDTELLPEIPVPGLYNGPSLYRTGRGRSFDDCEAYIATNKQTDRTRGLPDNNIMKSFSTDKEKASSVAKIKVVVRKRPLNKKELAKKEEDVITIEPNSNYLSSRN